MNFSTNKKIHKSRITLRQEMVIKDKINKQKLTQTNSHQMMLPDIDMKYITNDLTLQKR